MTSLSAKDLADQLLSDATCLNEGERHLVGIAGPPGSGKSTLVETLAKMLEDQVPGGVAIVAMDGYHFDDVVLHEKGWHSRKGAAHTFDVGGLFNLLQRLARNEEAFVTAPVFDRSIETARAGANIIPQSARLILVEGNYLLLDDPPWQQLLPLFDRTVMIRVDEAELIRRLEQRWVHHGLTPEEIRIKLEENDLPNGRLIYEKSIQAELEITN